MDARRSLFVRAEEIALPECEGWYYDQQTGEIRTLRGNFFRIVGTKGTLCSGDSFETPLVIQDEIGVLGLLARKIDGALHFLMQAKVEPGNEPTVQLSPTAQATYSNYTRSHGGSAPPFAEYFLEERGRVIVDSLKYEQCSRYIAKRNRNIIMTTDEDIPETDTHFYVTPGKIARLMPTGAVMMDTRTLLAMFPFREQGSSGELETRLDDYIRSHPFERRLCRLDELDGWGFDGSGFSSDGAPFGIVFRQVEIAGSEVRHWCQPLLSGIGGVYGSYVRDNGGETEFLCRIVSEPGCPSGALIGPAVFCEKGLPCDRFGREFSDALERRDNVVFDMTLSEEGGRFWREKNRYALVRYRSGQIPDDAFWVSDGELAAAIAQSNVCDIQLRSLYGLYHLMNREESP
ncbi:MAG: NDP-hexose 2,3-dehydratase family protein [Clostridia bacterium]|nr:NDP-hexose 2,3-dehydratase family protein [Clostridia bacterium]